MRSIMTPWRLKWYPRMCLLALVVSFLATILTGTGASTFSGRLGGDYPAFYGAGLLVATGDSRDLYRPEKQWQSQKGLLAGEAGYLPFVYPPFVAVVYWPLSLLDYRLSYLLHTLVMAGALVLALWLCRPFDERLRNNFGAAMCLCFYFYPILQAITGGQNSALSLLLIVISIRAVLAGRDWLAGVMLGLLLFKPQFAVPLIGLNMLSRRFRVVAWSGITALALYGIGAMVSGPNWIGDWLKIGWRFSEIDSGINYANSVSWMGCFAAISGLHGQFTVILGWTMVIATAGCLCLIWSAKGRYVDISEQWAVAVAGLPLLAPHVMYYDASIILITYFVLLAKSKDKSLIYGLTIWAMGLTQLSSRFTGFSPLFFLCVSVFILSLYMLSQPVLSKTAKQDQENSSLENGVPGKRPLNENGQEKKASVLPGKG